MDIMNFGRNSFVTWTTGLKERIQEAEKEIQMREIKFRAWDGKKMQYDVFPTSDNTVGRWIETGGGVELRFCDGGGTKVDIMQFTGLKGKNGKEIYGGDRLKNWKTTIIISWNEKRACWDAKDIETGQSSMLSSYGIRNDFEIIGNIHQPEEQDNA